MAPHKTAMPVPGSTDVFEERYWSAINSPTLGPDGAVRLFLHLVEDVTAFLPGRQQAGSRASRLDAHEHATEPERHASAKEPQELNEQLREAKTHVEQLLDRQRQFAADASHELRTPIASLRLQVEAAKLHPEDVDLPDLLEHVMGGIVRVENIISDLHLLARPQADTGRILEDVDLTELVETQAARWADRCNLRIDVDPAVTVNAAPGEIARLFVALLDNARRHATHMVEVRLHGAGEHAELAVTDDGQGIALPTANAYSGTSSGWTPPAAATGAVPAWGWPSRATSPQITTAPCTSKTRRPVARASSSAFPSPADTGPDPAHLHPRSASTPAL
ncbi:sensor histidine kinase [Nonomuraea sp. CA-141351]|uniref:sensor histidine kinase n=1 Tax=Nonomuraea sp. CA-141351 TaxID=3239996 RepID=UPI003D909D85